MEGFNKLSHFFIAEKNSWNNELFVKKITVCEDLIKYIYLSCNPIILKARCTIFEGILRSTLSDVNSLTLPIYYE